MRKTWMRFGGWIKYAAVFLWVCLTLASVCMTARAATTYTVTFRMNDGTDNVHDTQNVESGNYAEKPTTDPVRTHYTFGKWVTTSTGSTEFKFDTQKITANKTLYAYWIPDEHTMTFHSNGGTFDKESMPVTYGKRVADPGKSTREGYTFGGWYTDDGTFANEWKFGANTSGATYVEGDVDLYAKWNPIQYTITFKYYSTDTSTSLTLKTVKAFYDEIVTPPELPAWTHHKFNGWYKDEACTEQWNVDTDTVTGAMTLYAGWTAEKITITFYMCDEGNTVYRTDEIDYNTEVTEPTSPEREHYTFDKWVTTAGGSNKFSFITKRTADTSVYAKWTTSEKCIVRFDTQGGGPVADKTDVTYGSKISKPSSSPTKTGDTFDGWYYFCGQR